MKLLLGDQSPFNGGLVRALEAAEQSNCQVTYCFHDIDVPWVQRGVPFEFGVKLEGHNWVDYWAVAARMPFTLDAPKLEDPTTWHAVRQSLKAPGGIQYLMGPTTETTIRTASNCPNLGKLLSDMHQSEIDWAKRIADALGRTPKEAGRIPRALNEVVPAIKERVNGRPIEVTTTIGFWKEHEVKLAGKLPADNYWVVNESGRRKKWNGHVVPHDSFLVPGGKVLMLEDAAHEYVSGFSALPYLSEVRSLRDRYVPELIVPYCKITFSWSVGGTPLQNLIGAFLEKKKTRAEDKKLSFTPPTFNQKDLETMETYWSGRPTTLAYEVIGGDLNTTLTWGTI